MKAFMYRSQRHDCMVSGLQFDSGFQCFVLELPWRENEQEHSCIPEGVYQCALRPSRKWGPVPFGKTLFLLYELKPVQGRTDILIHSGNTIRDSLGCLLVGNAVSDDVSGATFIRNSRKTLMALHEHTQGKPFTLTISSI